MNIRRLLSACAAIVMTLLLLVPAAAGEGIENVFVRSAPLIRSAEVKDGMVRVWLASLGNLSKLNITVTGNYSVNGNTALALSTGDKVEVHFDKTTGQITMTMNGLTYAMGSEMRLRRHMANGESALSIAQADRPNNLYPGDLQLKAVKTSSGYRMYPILHVYLEYYLYGVVPYEMGSSFPLEALKAQAVAARNYTLRAMNNNENNDYDLGDTSAHQVYKGYTGTASRATQAVDETRGIIIMNDGKVSGTYYTASNGGQTEASLNVWGGSGYEYLCVKDDPFDAANPSSNRRRLTVYADFDHPSQSEALIQLLTEAAQTQLGTDAVIQTINSIIPHTPKYPAPSRLYTKIDFGVTALVGDSYVNANLSLPIFTKVESALSMSIQSSNNELWTVESVADGFRITVGRWGHGIGMSQRGAQQMANMGYTYDQILGFYYDGCVRMQYTFTHTILPPGSTSEIVSPEAPATISPSSEAKATVKLTGVNDVAPLRYTASESGRILTGIPNGGAVTVLAKGAEWSLIRYGGINGYLPTNWLFFTGAAPESSVETPTAINLWATVTGTNALNFRTSAAYGDNIQGSLASGSILCVLGTEGEWVKVQYGATVGYVSADYLEYHSYYPGETNGDTSAMADAGDGQPVPLLASPSTTATVLYQIPYGTQVDVLSNDGTWCQVDVGGLKGYVLTSQLNFTAEGSKPTDIPGVQGMTAIVNSTSSTLNLRQGPSTTTEKLAEIPKGTRIIVTVFGEEWCAVSWGSLSGYVMTKYLLFEEEETPTPTPSASASPSASPSPTPTLPPANTAWVRTTVNYINLRAAPGTEADIITTIPGGDELTVLASGSTWSYVEHGVATGYVLSSNLTYSQPLPSIGVLYIDTDVDPLYMRDAPRLNGSTVLTSIPRGEPVLLLEDLGSWCHVQYGAYVGYCSSQYLSRLKPTNYDPDDTPIYDPTLTAVFLWKARIATADQKELQTYKWCSLQAPERFVVPYGTVVELIERGDIWCKIEYEGETGYCLLKDLALISPV